MQKTIRNCICLAFITILSIMPCILVGKEKTAKAIEKQTDMSKFAERANEIYKNIGKTTYSDEQNRDKLFMDLYYSNNVSEQQLNKNGFFVYLEPEENQVYTEIETYTQNPTSALVPTNSSSDVDIAAPTIAYDAVLSEWKIVASFKWKNANWKTEDLGAQWDYRGGKTKRIGGDDIYGFQFNKYSIDFGNFDIFRKSAYIEMNKVDYYNRLLFDYEYLGTCQITDNTVSVVSNESKTGGIYFAVPDNLVITKINAMYYETGYGADTAKFSVNYNSNFENYDGTISTLVHHNYKTTRVEGIECQYSVGADGKISTNLSIKTTIDEAFWTVNSGKEVSIPTKRYVMRQL